MPVVEKLAPGFFCWVELATTDQSAAKHFYSSLFDWMPADFPMGPDGVYSVFRFKDRDCAALYTMRQEHRERGVAPNWVLYIATADVDESTRRAVELGGTVLAGPFDVMDKGRMSIIQDPTGAHFCLWQAKTETTGIGIAGENNTFCWADLLTRDVASAKRFYEGLFGWSLAPGEGKDATGYLHILNGAQMIGGIPPAEHMQQGVPPHWLIYIMVADCDASCDKAVSLGAHAYVSPMTIEGVGRMSVLADPQGAVFALFTGTV